MDLFRTRFLSPDSSDGNGSAPAASAPTPSVAAGGVQDGRGTASPSPSAGSPGIDHAKYERAVQQQAEHTRLWQELGNHGIKDRDSLLRAVADARRIESLQNDHRARGILDALAAPEPQPDPTKLPLTPATIQQMLDASLEKRDRASQERAAKERHTSALQTEMSNLESALTQDAAKAILNGAKFDEAQAGKAGVMARMFASHVDQLLVDRTYDPTTNRRIPATDPRIVAEAVAQAVKDFAEIKAATIHAGASGQRATAQPGVASTASRVEPIANPYEARKADEAARRAEVAQSFRASFERAASST